MMYDSNDLQHVILEVSHDHSNYETLQEITAIPKQLPGDESGFGFITNLMDTGKKILRDNKYKSFRIHLKKGQESFFIYCTGHKHKSVASKAVLSQSELNRQEKSYQKLSKREVQAICFLYRGYNQHQAAAFLKIKLNTFKQHRKHLYSKMGFRNRFDLFHWCDRYLDSLFEGK
jgi:DNA-binding CsgD family transcriptional regulator